ncbi:MAG: RuvX/YqgF family protein, partial [Patescibacteria group bacterium]
EAISILEKIARDAGVEKIVVGISEGEMGRESKAFGEELSRKVGIEVEFEDETLSTQDSQALSILAGAGRKKRKEMEDAFAAALMLQSYLEKKEHV